MRMGGDLPLSERDTQPEQIGPMRSLELMVNNDVIYSLSRYYYSSNLMMSLSIETPHWER